jgi:hypothetical protein
MSSRRHLPVLMVALAFLTTPVFAQTPQFATKTPVTGNTGSAFFVFLPVANFGTGAASNMQLTSVTLNHLGAPAAPTLVPATLPSVTGSGYLGPGGVRTLDLEFDNSKLAAGNTYLLTLRGTYQVGGTTRGFALNRPVAYAPGFAATHQQVLDLIGTKFQSLPGVDRQADNQTLRAFVDGLPQISAAGVGVTSSLVWARFADSGRTLVILNNRPLTAQPTISSANAPSSALVTRDKEVAEETAVQSAIADQLLGSATEIPQSIKARLLNGFGSGIANPVPDIHEWLVDKQAYSDPIGADASVAGLRHVGGDGVFYINSHGGADSTAAESIPYHIWTNTETTDDCLPPSTICPDPLLPGDILNGRVDEFIAINQYDPGSKEFTKASHYSIYATKFVTEYPWNFAGNAFVYIDTCDSAKNDPSVQEFKNLLFKQGASVYAGWTDETGGFSGPADTARLVFDRLIGADQFCPEDGQPCHSGAAEPPVFAQRPFAYTEVATDLIKHKLATSGKAQLTFDPPNGSGFGLLAPSISNMSVDESMGQAGQLTINGIFGQDPRPNGSVQIGGMDATIESWSVNSIVVDLNSSGSLSAGDVQVKVRLHKSNVARLTEWRADPFTYTISGNGSLQLIANFNLHFRTDIRKYREHIHVPPKEPMSGSLAANDSTGTYTASGSGPGIGETFNWSGSGTLVYATRNIPITGLSIFEATAQIVDSTHLKSTVGAVSEAKAGATCTVIVPQAPPQKSFLPVEGPSNLAGLVPTVPWYFNFELDSDNADILPNESSTSGGGIINSYFCMDDRQTARYDFKWGPVPATPGTAPDPKSAR